MASVFGPLFFGNSSFGAVTSRFAVDRAILRGISLRLTLRNLGMVWMSLDSGSGTGKSTAIAISKNSISISIIIAVSVISLEMAVKMMITMFR